MFADISNVIAMIREIQTKTMFSVRSDTLSNESIKPSKSFVSASLHL